jgi:hypothetical protein
MRLDSNVRGGSISSDFSVGRGGLGVVRKKQFGAKLAGASKGIAKVGIGHATNILQTRGLSASGAEDIVNGRTLSNSADKLIAPSAVAAPFLPGGAVVSAAVGGGGGSGPKPAGSG